MCPRLHNVKHPTETPDWTTFSGAHLSEAPLRVQSALPAYSIPVLSPAPATRDCHNHFARLRSSRRVSLCAALWKHAFFLAASSASHACSSGHTMQPRMIVPHLALRGMPACKSSLHPLALAPKAASSPRDEWKRTPPWVRRRAAGKRAAKSTQALPHKTRRRSNMCDGRCIVSLYSPFSQLADLSTNEGLCTNEVLDAARRRAALVLYIFRQTGGMTASMASNDEQKEGDKEQRASGSRHRRAAAAAVVQASVRRAAGRRAGSRQRQSAAAAVVQAIMRRQPAAGYHRKLAHSRNERDAFQRQRFVLTSRLFVQCAWLERERSLSPQTDAIPRAHSRCTRSLARPHAHLQTTRRGLSSTTV